MPTIEPVDHHNAPRFVAYAATYGIEHDTSFLPEAGFVPTADQPTYLLVEDGQDVGAASLLLFPRYREAGRARFAIFHSRLGTLPAYRMLLDALGAHWAGLHSAYLFIPDTLPHTAAILAQLGFHVERYSFALVLETIPQTPPELPAGLRAVPVRADDPLRLRQFAEAVNLGFQDLAGHLDLKIADLQQWFLEETYVEDGIGLILDGEVPIGTYTVAREYEDRQAGEIGGLSVHPARRGVGLGRLVLRHAIGVAAAHGLHPIYLSVNAENDSALGLYRSQGFRQTETVVCHSLDLR